MSREKACFDAKRMPNKLIRLPALPALTLIILWITLSGKGLAGAVEASSLGAPFLDRSSVVFTQPLFQDLKKADRGRYGKYKGEIVMWGFTPSSFHDFSIADFDATHEKYRDRIAAHQNAGLKWVSRVEWDVIWNGMTQKFPKTYQEAFARRLDGSPLPITWFPGHMFFSTHSPLFQDYLEWQIKTVAMSGLSRGKQLDGLLFDSQHATPAHYNQGGDFSDACMDNFSRWLADKFSKSERADLGLPLNKHFHYGQYLLAQGWTVETYEQESEKFPNTIPLSALYRQFLTEWNNRHVEHLVHTADEFARLSGYPEIPGKGYIRVGSSSQLLDPYWKGLRFVHSEAIDFYVQEFNHRPESGALNGSALLLYKLAEARGKPLALTAQPYPDWNYMVDNPDAVDMVRLWIAQAYANGAIFMVPEQMWAYNKKNEQRYYNARSGDYDFIYRWITENRRLFDGYETRADVGVVYDFNAYIETDFEDLEALAISQALMESNTPFHLLVAGNEAWPKYLTDSDQLMRMGELDLILAGKLSRTKMEKQQNAVLLQHAEKTLDWPFNDSFMDSGPRKIEVASPKVSSYPREKPTDAGAPKVIHFVNHDFSEGTKRVTTKRNLQLRISGNLFQPAIKAAIYHQAGKQKRKLSVDYADGYYHITLPVLESWGLLELSSIQSTVLP